MENVMESLACNESEALGVGMNSCEGDAQARSAADTVARRSYGKLVAFLAAQARDVAAAEDALSEAFVSALTDWPQNGCPSNPEAWLLTVARRKMIDLARRRQHGEAAAARLQLHWQVSTRRRLAVGARISSMRGAGQLGGGCAALRRAVGAYRLAGGRRQSRPGHRGVAWRPRGPRCAARGGRRCAAHGIPALLGCASGTAGQDRSA